MKFQDKVVIITGAGSGIGAAAAHRFYAEGATIVLCGRRQAKLAAVSKTFDRDRHLVQPADVTAVAEVERLVSETLRRFNRIDVLVNNAGTGEVGGFLDMTQDQWRQVFATNVDGVFNVTRAALPHLIRTRGSIVNVSSLSGLGGDRGLNFYSTTKGAVSNLTRNLAIEFAARGVRVNAVCPTTTLTELTRTAFEPYPELFGQLLERIPLGRFAEPEEVASAIAFLASDDASFITGVNLPVDGGIHAGSGQAPFLS